MWYYISIILPLLFIPSWIVAIEPFLLVNCKTLWVSGVDGWPPLGLPAKVHVGSYLAIHKQVPYVGSYLAINKCMFNTYIFATHVYSNYMVSRSTCIYMFMLYLINTVYVFMCMYSHFHIYIYIYISVMVHYRAASTSVVFSDAPQGSLFRSVCLPFRGRVGGAFPYYAVFGFLWNQHFLFQRIKSVLDKKRCSRGRFARRLPWEDLQLESLSGPGGSLLNSFELSWFTPQPLHKRSSLVAKS